jgi:SH3-like domain-containing protein
MLETWRKCRDIAAAHAWLAASVLVALKRHPNLVVLASSLDIRKGLW